ncbi:MAG: CoA-binding protein [Leptospiraceae bacterium]|nr:CoA-binding protein [Leptospiraceae bacterium]MDW8305594.1 CoA-binding protein [Leptospiraceae bacterium]
MGSEHDYFRALLGKNNCKIALVGATNDKSKYGNIILHHLLGKGYRVYPVNPRAKTIDGIPAYANLSSLPEKVDIVNFVLPPKLGKLTLEEGLKLNLDNFWFQPGAESPEIIEILEKSGKHYLADGSCIMVMSAQRRASA